MYDRSTRRSKRPRRAEFDSNPQYNAFSPSNSQQDTTSQQSDIASVQSDTASVQSDTASVQSDTTSVQSGMTSGGPSVGAKAAAKAAAAKAKATREEAEKHAMMRETVIKQAMARVAAINATPVPTKLLIAAPTASIPKIPITARNVSIPKAPHELNLSQYENETYEQLADHLNHNMPHSNELLQATIDCIRKLNGKRDYELERQEDLKQLGYQTIQNLRKKADNYRMQYIQLRQTNEELRLAKGLPSRGYNYYDDNDGNDGSNDNDDNSDDGDEDDDDDDDDSNDDCDSDSDGSK